MKTNKRQFLGALGIMAGGLILSLLLVLLLAGAAGAQPAVQVTIDESACGRFSALVTGAEPGDQIRFQLGHDLVQTKEVSEQDTPVRFDSGPFPASDWGFEVRVNDTEIFNEAVTVKPCARTLEVTDFDCNTVTVLGNGWAQTEATVEVAIPPAEGGESRDDLLVIKQVQPSSEGVFHVTLDWPGTPPTGRYAAVVLIDNIQQDPQSDGFQVSCTGDQLPFTGSQSTTLYLTIAVVLLGIGVLLLLLRTPKN